MNDPLDHMRFVRGAVLYARNYQRICETGDHDHCVSCWDKFMEEDLPDVLHCGFATQDERHWVCQECFEKFKDAMERKLGQE